ncbi:MAG: hypothetical protein AAGA60_10785 [Cyanobacteria bacterium P01_E01_bin.42]
MKLWISLILTQIMGVLVLIAIAENHPDLSAIVALMLLTRSSLRSARFT